MKSLTLHRGREGALQRFSPWVFSGAVKTEAEGLEDGDLVQVSDASGQALGTGHYQEGSIRVRMLHFGDAPYPEDLIDRRLATALALRGRLGLAEDPLTNAYRLVHAAGDGLPGLIVDRYASVAVVQCHSIGMHRQRERIAAALLRVPGIDSVYDKSAAALPQRYAGQATDGTLAGSAVNEVVVLENGRRFQVDLVNGQKTGFFLDQRDNRWLLGSYARDCRVLNTFCYTGGFSVYALLGGAAQVQSVDLSERATALTEANVAANGDFADRHTAHMADVMDFLKEAEPRSFDIVVVDPPAYAKNKHRRHKAVQAYKRLNARAMAALRPGGLLFTFSCSRVVDRQLFYDTIVAAGLESGRSARVLHRLAQSPDHPVSLYHPEGEYLKGLVLQVD
ncbi:class I SAM-dependent rRNA methyltransferase [Lewinella sp. IMCC34183]|uniref:class I SAM-dependent rRNA methyltransferase n=1 Tax=Lewinella sp. IMCC34183 TaxID=2248762 RepID=UPI000E257626|nr:class I SAM-dependent rRNA methyltransferase [Lewinella sp. IMCC34183]